MKGFLCALQTGETEGWRRLELEAPGTVAAVIFATGDYCERVHPGEESGS